MPDKVNASQKGAESERILLFGANGAIGGAIAKRFLSEEWHVVGTARRRVSENERIDWLEVDPFDAQFDGSVLRASGPYSAVCWAQGANLNDSIYDVSLESHMELYRANCLYIVATLQKLLTFDLLKPASRLCVVSSIWQNMARQNKFSYTVTKAALQGLVLSVAADIAANGHLINAVLPGALDTPMTRRNLGADQIARLEEATKFNRLPALADVANLVFYLCSSYNTGVTGQFIAADLGFSHVRLV
ncbi:SDR family oxidoreductase [uncultured Methylovirgula sp.]|uniref:SDR family NAD(P)-dependent oxidoreductase n=1 Tax=uncultured Methylovirgula sp. TaxID=1285960 RepID=UPI00261BE1E3|nr:SDR family oxidoreductase [uncultured Methylovirgula sp.]